MLRVSNRQITSSVTPAQLYHATMHPREAVSRVATPPYRMARQPFLPDALCALLAALPTPPAAELACTFCAQVLHDLAQSSMTTTESDKYKKVRNIHVTLTHANAASAECNSATSMPTFAQRTQYSISNMGYSRCSTCSREVRNCSKHR